ncbi:glycoside hydrolase family 99-like domain-containing protein [Halochromatium roseum]|uniref:glycoside hydrolase family 99-like domain-containing protein n=1 Tax=Halochromatium roseum TaxID=391920 RepID=UPI0019142107|nr:glycoside hydrolase family 99-like domain-containing protein [Halochromatium roseum]
MHVYQIAEELVNRGHQCTVSSPIAKQWQLKDKMLFKHISYQALKALDESFNIIHAWTARSHVIEALDGIKSANADAKIILHQEDNEWEIVKKEYPITYDGRVLLSGRYSKQILEKFRYRTIFADYQRTLSGASAQTFLIDEMSEIYPSALPVATLRPGSVFESLGNKDIGDIEDGNPLRDKLVRRENVLVIGYVGTVHDHTKDGFIDLVAAVKSLRAHGYDIVIYKTGGISDAGLAQEIQMENYVVNFGFLDLKQLGKIMRLCSLFVLPWGDKNFDRYRFPSKIPDFLFFEKPFLIARINVGLKFSHLFNNFLIDQPGFSELKEKLEKIALLHLEGTLSLSQEQIHEISLIRATYNWKNTGKIVEDLYLSLLEQSTPSIPAAVSNTDDLSGKNQCGNPHSLFRVLAFYLPQFHPIPENDEWWGKGFTEWTGVSLAKPQFEKHQQPRIPSELGFYDLRLEEALLTQVNYAHRAGVFGFCFYYYWFGGKRLLERPLDIFVNSPNLKATPFCICWANEPWSRKYDGSGDSLLIEQNYQEADVLPLANDIAKYIKCENYIRIDSEPVIFIYRANHIPFSPMFLGLLKETISLITGFKVKFVCIQSFDVSFPFAYSCDYGAEFTPYHYDRSLVDVSYYNCENHFSGYLEDFLASYAKMLSHQPLVGTNMRCLFPQWDNTPRRGRKAHILVNSSPFLYALSLFEYYRHLQQDTDTQGFILLNALNEWGEGAIIEPDMLTGPLYGNLTRIAQERAYAFAVTGDLAEFKIFIQQCLKNMIKFDGRLSEAQRNAYQDILNKTGKTNDI